jgi:hypothetical protein
VQACVATSILRYPDPAHQPGTEFIRQFLRENGRQPNTPEVFEGGRAHERETDCQPGYASLQRLSASDRDDIFNMLDVIERRFDGRGGIFALDSLHSQLLSIELAEAELSA